MFCPPPPQSNIELVEQHNTIIYRKVIKSNDLSTVGSMDLHITNLHSNTVQYSNLYEQYLVNSFIQKNDLVDYLSKVEQHSKKYFPHSVIHK